MAMTMQDFWHKKLHPILKVISNKYEPGRSLRRRSIPRPVRRASAVEDIQKTDWMGLNDKMKSFSSMTRKYRQQMSTKKGRAKMKAKRRKAKGLPKEKKVIMEIRGLRTAKNTGIALQAHAMVAKLQEVNHRSETGTVCRNMNHARVRVANAIGLNISDPRFEHVDYLKERDRGTVSGKVDVIGEDTIRGLAEVDKSFFEELREAQEAREKERIEKKQAKKERRRAKKMKKMKKNRKDLELPTGGGSKVSADQTYLCEHDCGFRGDFDSVAQHELSCKRAVRKARAEDPRYAKVIAPVAESEISKHRKKIKKKKKKKKREKKEKKKQQQQQQQQQQQRSSPGKSGGAPAEFRSNAGSDDDDSDSSDDDSESSDDDAEEPQTYTTDGKLHFTSLLQLTRHYEATVKAKRKADEEARRRHQTAFCPLPNPEPEFAGLFDKHYDLLVAMREGIELTAHSGNEWIALDQLMTEAAAVARKLGVFADPDMRRSLEELWSHRRQRFFALAHAIAILRLHHPRAFPRDRSSTFAVATAEGGTMAVGAALLYPRLRSSSSMEPREPLFRFGQLLEKRYRVTNLKRRIALVQKSLYRKRNNQNHSSAIASAGSLGRSKELKTQRHKNFKAPIDRGRKGAIATNIGRIASSPAIAMDIGRVASSVSIASTASSPASFPSSDPVECHVPAPVRLFRAEGFGLRALTADIILVLSWHVSREDIDELMELDVLDQIRPDAFLVLLARKSSSPFADAVRCAPEKFEEIDGGECGELTDGMSFWIFQRIRSKRRLADGSAWGEHLGGGAVVCPPATHS